MFNKNKKQDKSEGIKTLEKKSNSTKQVKVVSKTIFNEKVVVIIKKIKPKVGPVRESFNSYLFDRNGECIMPEKDAILFWNDMQKKRETVGDISVFSLNNEVEYEFDKVKKLYEIEEVDLENSEPRI